MPFLDQRKWNSARRNYYDQSSQKLFERADIPNSAPLELQTRYGLPWGILGKNVWLNKKCHNVTKPMQNIFALCSVYSIKQYSMAK